MNTNEWESDAKQRGDSAGSTGAENPSASQTASHAAERVVDEAQAIAREAGGAIRDQTAKAKDTVVSNLEAFADAMRSASDQLGRQQTGPAAELVSHAASGLETLSRSIDGKSTGEMIDAVRRFGRDNPIGFIAGSILAGFALGRVASAAGLGSSASGAPQKNGSQSREEISP